MNQVFILGIAGYPNAYTAKISRYKAITQNVASEGNQVFVINREVRNTVVSDGSDVKIYNASNLDVKSYTVHKYLRKLVGLFEFFRLLALISRKVPKVFIVYTSSPARFLRYLLFAKLLNAKLVYDYVEKVSEFNDTGHSRQRLNYAKLFEKYLIRKSDGVFVISEFLKNELSRNDKEIKLFKIPAIFDFKLIENIQAKMFNYNYLLYCGTTDYISVVKFVIEAFKSVQSDSNVRLILILNGQDSLIDDLKRELEDTNPERIEIHRKLEYNDLLAYYKGALGLLIPLRNIVRDIARFPHKISEYSASKSIIISNNVGEVGFYFKNGESALLADKYDAKVYGELIQKVVDGDIMIEHIRDEGHLVGLNNFDSNNLNGLTQFFNSL
ncbi:glycosyltransferase [Carboxylicivirga linearis]|uniref:Glycosyltransferase n=1 Tax=Carboxylicivirga linearis TaxID=1628157 RepID=A0ABS5JW12_9BACT|nr:glycosyltransferase [Carboxylicivirga linearis]MBS2099082.1 glycosyltransferase [Carboxylicivirga linearis]